MTEYSIDAQGKKLGRVAGEAAIVLMGKKQPDFARNSIPDMKVKIVNASKLDIDTQRLENTHHTRYTGHPGGLRKERTSRIAEKKGYAELVRHAVSGMLPANRLRNKMMKNLIINE